MCEATAVEGTWARRLEHRDPRPAFCSTFTFSQWLSSCPRWRIYNSCSGWTAQNPLKKDALEVGSSCKSRPPKTRCRPNNTLILSYSSDLLRHNVSFSFFVTYRTPSFALPTMPAQRLLRPARYALRTLPSASAVSSRACICRRSQQLPVISLFSTSSSSYSSSGSSSHDGVNQSGPIDPQPASELQLGELPGGTFRIEPLRRVGEDVVTTRARLLCRFS